MCAHRRELVFVHTSLSRPARERRKQLTAAEAVNHKRQLAQMVERELALTGADSVTDFDDALQMVIVETAFGRYPKHLLDVYTGKVVGRAAPRTDHRPA